jgi:hypothetical protein
LLDRWKLLSSVSDRRGRVDSSTSYDRKVSFYGWFIQKYEKPKKAPLIFLLFLGQISQYVSHSQKNNSQKLWKDLRSWSSEHAVSQILTPLYCEMNGNQIW